jgi:hypothetical protein
MPDSMASLRLKSQRSLSFQYGGPLLARCNLPEVHFFVDAVDYEVI